MAALSSPHSGEMQNVLMQISENALRRDLGVQPTVDRVMKLAGDCTRFCIDTLKQKVTLHGIEEFLDYRENTRQG